jgi:acetyltransferase
VGGVKLNLADAAAVRSAFEQIKSSVTAKAGAQHFNGVSVQAMITGHAYEIILGSSIDVQFGPVVLFGMGGELVEVFKDRALALPPLNTTLARRMMEQTKIYTALGGVRGRKSVDMDALQRILVRFSQLVVELPRIKEIDINPLRASSDRLIALDARVVLHDAKVPDAQLPRPVIRPYPTQYVKQWRGNNGTGELTIRPIRPEDEPLMVKFHHTLSEESVYFRYFGPMKLDTRIAHDRLARMCFVDYEREIALVADRVDPSTGQHSILAVARLSKLKFSDVAEFAAIVSDGVQRHGLGTEMLAQLIQIARAEGCTTLRADILPFNKGMQRVCEKLGFTLTRSSDNETVEAVLEL